MLPIDHMQRRGMSLATALFASIIVAIVASVAIFGFSQTNNASPAVPDCNQQVSAGIPLNMNMTAAPVFHITSTKAVICVNYKFEGAQTTNFFTNVQPWYQTGDSLNDAQCSTTACPTVTATPASAYHGAGSEVAAAYTITSSANLTGLFLLFHAGCSPFILAFGSTPSSVYLTAWTCGPVNIVSDGYRSDNYNVTGVTNVAILTVPWS
jgi:hypothetical protein